jgi:predicted phosphodiesterase
LGKKINTDFKNRHVRSNYIFKNYEGTQLERSILLIADNQFNNIFQDPSIMRNKIADSFAPVSIRPPQLDIYSKELFKFVLNNNHAKNKYVIHLGDALNIACENEWETFKDTLNKTIDKKKFVMAPGNHDFYWFGTTAGGTEKIKLQWGKSCSDVFPIEGEKIPTKKEYLSMRMTKGKFIESYLKFLNLDINISQGKIDKQFKGFIRKIYVKRYKNKEEDDYKSFILQLIDIPTQNSKVIKGIIIDTSNYSKKPLNAFGRIHLNGHENAGLKAGITKEQISKIKEWMEDDSTKYIIFGHHPLSEFRISIKKVIEKILKKPNVLGYVSAHTHLGYVEEKNNEINVGSITDYPNEIRTLESLKSNENYKLISKSILIAPYDVNSTLCKAKYDYTASFPNYTSYELAGSGIDTAHKVHEEILDISIKTLLREFHDLNNSKDSDKCMKIKDNAIKVLKEKKKGNSYSRANKERRHKKLEILKKLFKCRNSSIYLNKYGACQSLWSSKAEWIKNNTNNLLIKCNKYEETNNLP